MAPEVRPEHGKRKFQARPDFERCPGLARGEATDRDNNRRSFSAKQRGRIRPRFSVGESFFGLPQDDSQFKGRSAGKSEIRSAAGTCLRNDADMAFGLEND